MLLRSLTLVFYVLVLVVLCLTVVYSKPACNEGFYTKNGNLILDLHNFQSQFDCVQRMHRG
ncbi:uncharacterized protein LOC6576280 [Drosophila mojavensis]|uniref:Uncharacterized protein n=1 Tax=Drosophila mojavensis TaxID=7230 RepID=B4KKY3_DROMO|nr:uncharacterized protein LOC6576280 [Drosophila mojavensis]EDW11713.1 uncharacterized protein Dmoj_GI17295 [Drosophila mojavensis]